MTEKYHQQKLKELRESENERVRAIAEYNVMMGILGDPSEGEEEDDDE